MIESGVVLNTHSTVLGKAQDWGYGLGQAGVADLGDGSQVQLVRWAEDSLQTVSCLNFEQQGSSLPPRAPWSCLAESKTFERKGKINVHDQDSLGYQEEHMICCQKESWLHHSFARCSVFLVFPPMKWVESKPRCFCCKRHWHLVYH